MEKIYETKFIDLNEIIQILRKSKTYKFDDTEVPSEDLLKLIEAYKK